MRTKTVNLAPNCVVYTVRLCGCTYLLVFNLEHTEYRLFLLQDGQLVLLYGYQGVEVLTVKAHDLLVDLFNRFVVSTLTDWGSKDGFQTALQVAVSQLTVDRYLHFKINGQPGETITYHLNPTSVARPLYYDEKEVSQS